MKEVILQFSPFRGVSAPPGISQQQRIAAILGDKGLNAPLFHISVSLGGVLIISGQENLQEQLLEGSWMDPHLLVEFLLPFPILLPVKAGRIPCPLFTFSAPCWNHTSQENPLFISLEWSLHLLLKV